MFKRSESGGYWMVLDTALTTASSVLAGLLVARYLGPDDYGRFSLAISITAVFGGLISLNATPFLMAEVSRNSDRLSQIFGTVLVTQMFLSAVAFLPMIAMGLSLESFAINRQINFYLLAVCSGAAVAHLFSQPRVVLINQGRYQQLALTGICATLVGLLGRIGIVYGKGTVVSLALVILCENILRALLIIIFARQLRFQILPLGWNKQIFREMVPICTTSLAILLLNLSFLNIDLFILSYFFNAETLGHYAAVQRIGTLTLALIIAFSLPDLAIQFDAANRTPKDARSIFLASLKRVSVWSLICCTGIGLSAPIFVPFLLGVEYKASVPILQMMMLSLPFMTLAQLGDGLFWSLDKKKVIVGRLVLAFTIKVLAVVLFALNGFAPLWVAATSLALVPSLILFDVRVLWKDLLK